MIKWPVDNFADRFFSNDIYVGDDKRFISLAVSVFERANFKCHYCDFECSPTPEVPTAYFQIRALNNNYRDLDSSNLGCVCTFCHSMFNTRASLRSGNYIPIRNGNLKPTTLSTLLKALMSELSSRNNSFYDGAISIYKELEGYSSNIHIPEFTTLHLESDDAGERARKARTAFILNVIALADGGGYQQQTKVAMHNILPFPRFSSFSDLSDFYSKNVFSKVRKSESLLKLYSRM